MALNITLIILAAIIVIIWLLIEMKRFRHKFFAIFLIFLIVFFYITAYFVFKDKQVNLKTMSGINDATKVYLTFLGGAFKNVKTITANAVNMDWKPSNSTLDPNLRSK
jgi:predicted membrane metal-binding protein